MSVIQQPLTQLEQEVFDYLNDTPNARERDCIGCNGTGGLLDKPDIICGVCEGKGKTPAARIETLAARISHEMDVRWTLALEIVNKWKQQIN